jgi:hypothetical protein
VLTNVFHLEQVIDRHRASLRDTQDVDRETNALKVRTANIDVTQGMNVGGLSREIVGVVKQWEMPPHLVVEFL